QAAHEVPAEEAGAARDDDAALGPEAHAVFARARAPRGRADGRGAGLRDRGGAVPSSRSRSAARSASTIIAMRAGKETRGRQPNPRRALEASPTRTSTSVGR